MQALSNLVPHEEITLHGAGRTDTGVHALGQVVSFQTNSAIPLTRWAIALNSNLPSDISIAKAEEADRDFHARFSARSRTYGYLLWTRRTRSAIWGRYSQHLRFAVDVAEMQYAAGLLTGIYDFASFARTGEPGPSTVRHLQKLTVKQIAHDKILITAKATGFLRTMVRNLVGALVEVGRGNLKPADVFDILQAKDRTLNPCAPAAPQGLFLWRVEY